MTHRMLKGSRGLAAQQISRIFGATLPTRALVLSLALATAPQGASAAEPADAGAHLEALEGDVQAAPGSPQTELEAEGRAAETAAEEPPLGLSASEPTVLHDRAPTAGDQGNAGTLFGPPGSGDVPPGGEAAKQLDPQPPATQVLGYEPLPISTIAPRLSDMTRHVGRWSDDLWCDAPDGSALGVVRRAYYRQVYRHEFQYFNQAGVFAGSATQPLFSLGLFSRKLQRLYVKDSAGARVATLKGIFFTWSPVKYHVEDASGTRVLDVYIDRIGQSVLFTPPKNPTVRVAKMLREQQAGIGNDRWHMILDEDKAFDFATWSLIQAFFVNLASPSAPWQPAG